MPPMVTERTPRNEPCRTVPVRNDTVTSTALLGAEQRIWIEHLGERYQLRQTRQGKLILTK